MMGNFLRIGITRLEIIAFAVGMAILTFELVAARIVSPYLGDTIYTWTSIIGVILASLSLGYYKGGLWADRRKNQNDIVYLLCLAAIFIALVNLQKDPVLAILSGMDMPLQLRALIASLLLFTVPTFVLGVVMPYLARLSIQTVATSGQHLARIDTASTLGSLLGTFLTGYWLFGLVGSNNLLTGIAIILVISSMLIGVRKLLRLQFLVLAIIILGSFISTKPQLLGFVTEIDTAYSNYVIRDISYNEHKIRALQSGGEGIQSGVYIDGTVGLPFPYIRGFIYASELRPRADRYLIIGGGAFTFPEFLANNNRQARIDTVEIDELLPNISKDFFNFNQPQNLRIIHDDGRNFLNENKLRYNMIFLDAFTATVPPFQLFTREAMKSANNSLAEDGIIVINLISSATGPKSEMLHRAYSTVRNEFPEVYVFQASQAVPEARQNLLLVGSKQVIEQTELTEISSKHPEFAHMIKAELKVTYKKDLVMTDNYAPVEKLAR